MVVQGNKGLSGCRGHFLWPGINLAVTSYIGRHWKMNHHTNIVIIGLQWNIWPMANCELWEIYRYF
ncbi:hypothetical protein DHD05_15095 [Arenibacter sp. N53]|nr:hypothetical protein [Arenibacter sp. N53]